MVTTSTSRRTCDCIVDCIFLAQYTYSNHSVASDNITGEEFVILFEFLGHSIAHVAHVVNEIGVNISLHTAYSEVAHRHTSATSLIEDVVNQLALSETVEKRCSCTLVHCQAAVAKQVTRQTHKLVHHHSD